MTPEDKKTLSDLVLHTALGKQRVLLSIDAHLRAAVRECGGWEELWNTFSDDDEIGKLKDAIQKLSRQIRNYTDDIVEAVTGTYPDEYEFVGPGEIFDLRKQEAEERGVKFGPDEDSWATTLWPDDPLALYKRLKGGAE